MLRLHIFVFAVLLLVLCQLIEAQMMGGFQDADITDANVQRLAGFATSELSKTKNGQTLQLIRIIKARTQLVAGMRYDLTLEVIEADCNTCLVERCHVMVYERPWEDKRSATVGSCVTIDDSQPKEILKADTDNEMVIKVANFAVNSINEFFCDTLIKVFNSSQQSEAGAIMYKITLRMLRAECPNDTHEVFGITVPPMASHEYDCLVIVWATGVGPTFHLLHSSCQIYEEPIVATHVNPLGGDDHDLCHGGMFVEFMERHNKKYKSKEEELDRFKIFCENMKKVRELQKNEQGTATYGATVFADLTAAEFSAYVGSKWDITQLENMKQAEIPKGSFPESFDWRDHNAVTVVKNQGSCGSCWAFSTTGNIEGQWSVKKGKLISLSEQELVDCDKLDQGCEGGLPSNAYKEIIRLGGLETEAEYKYRGKDEKCEFVKSEVRAFINSSVALSTNEDDMAAWLAKNGPISIGINAFAMQFYFGGISHPWKIFCNPDHLDHGVLIVGYAKKGSEPYWIIKNSWGPGWGEKGYYLVYRGDGVCGLNKMPTSSIVD